MSRRPPNPAAERAAQNQQTLKSLLKIESNKMCADCKKNKHPRWASWNLGIFVCIRCSGIHRSMGTHISRVKSVDLDSWTDEQLQSVLNWGNARANKYWEAKLNPGHVPQESKIENFIRTKYELKRWAMEGGRPDPASLDAEGDDDVPLSVVKEKQNIERKESVRKGPARTMPQPDLIGGDDIPPRASTGPPVAQVPPKAAPAPPKAVSNTKDSLLGLDFLGESPAAPPRPSSTASTGGMGAAPSRPDLKQSILSLYATGPPRPAQPQQPAHGPSGSFGGGWGAMQSPTSPQMGHQQKPSGGGLNDAFAGLSFGQMTSPQSPPPQRDPFAGIGGQSSSRHTPQASSSGFGGLGGGGFFNPKPSQPAAAAPSAQIQPSISSPTNSFGGFSSPTAAPKPAQSSAGGLGDLFDWSQPSAAPAPKPAPKAAAPPPQPDSVFNLSANAPKPAPAPASAAPNPMASTNISASDVWGSSAWGAPEPSPAAAKSPEPAKSSVLDMGGWGSSTGGSFANQSIVPGASGGGFAPQPKVAADEEFGGWTSSTGNTSTPKPSGGGFGGGNDDLFSNVWE